MMAEDTKTPPEEVKERTVMGYRIDRFCELGFTKLEAEKLAASTTVVYVKDKKDIEQRYESPLHYTRVRDALDAGCSHKTAFNIFT